MFGEATTVFQMTNQDLDPDVLVPAVSVSEQSMLYSEAVNALKKKKSKVKQMFDWKNTRFFNEVFVDENSENGVNLDKVEEKVGINWNL